MPRTSTATQSEVLVQLGVLGSQVGTLQEQIKDHSEQLRVSAVASAAQTAKIVEALGNGKPGRIETTLLDMQQQQKWTQRILWMGGGALLVAETALRFYEAAHR